MIKRIVVAGATCTGKTKLGIMLARKLRGEIVSADSRQVYRLMDIGTAKPGRDQRQQAPHHMIDIVYPDQPYTAADFSREGADRIKEIEKKGGTPIIAGGSGLYIKALVDGLFHGPGADWSIRKSLEEESEQSGPGKLHARLKALDPVSAARIHPNDKRRIIRALEFYQKTGTPISARQTWGGGDLKNYYFAGLQKPREELYGDINSRVDEMFEAGLAEEVRKLLRLGYDEKLVSMEAVGYRETAALLRGKLSFKEAKERIKANTRNYARRQLTWFGKDRRIRWFYIRGPGSIESAARSIIEELYTS